MRNLLNFIIRYSTWFVFTFYVLISVMLLVLGNRYQQSVYLTSANVISGGLYNGASQVTGYFHLKSINESLQASNAQLQNEVLNLKSQLAQYKVLLSDTLAPLLQRPLRLCFRSRNKQQYAVAQKFLHYRQRQS